MWSLRPLVPRSPQSPAPGTARPGHSRCVEGVSPPSRARRLRSARRWVRDRGGPGSPWIPAEEFMSMLTREQDKAGSTDGLGLRGWGGCFGSGGIEDPSDVELLESHDDGNAASYTSPCARSDPCCSRSMRAHERVRRQDRQRAQGCPRGTRACRGRHVRRERNQPLRKRAMSLPSLYLMRAASDHDGRAVTPAESTVNTLWGGSPSKS